MSPSSRERPVDRAGAGAGRSGPRVEHELVDRAEVGAGDLADRGVHRVADDHRAGDDRRAEERAEDDERRLARAPEGIADGEATQHGAPREDPEERQREQQDEDERAVMRDRESGTLRERHLQHGRRRVTVLDGDQPVGAGAHGGVVGDQDAGSGPRHAARRGGPSRTRPSRSRGCRSARRPRSIRPPGQRTRDRDALLLAARELRRPAVEPVTEADALERLTRALRASAPGTRIEQQRQLDVLGRREDGDQVERLEDEAHRLGAMPRARGVRRARGWNGRRPARGPRRSRPAPRRS